MQKVLLVDDSLSYRIRLKEGLMDAGYQVIEAENGRDGLGILRDDQSIAFVVCDLNMPVLNGFGMLREGNDQGVLRDLPVIMLTTEGSRELKEEGKKLGVKAWISKMHTPKDAQLVAMAIDHILGKNRKAS